MNSKTGEWPFDQPRNCAIFTLRQIVNRSAPILMVTHDSDDHGWQFLDGGGARMEDAMVLSLEEITEIDPSVMLVADILPGWQAVRKSPNAVWQRQQTPQTA